MSCYPVLYALLPLLAWLGEHGWLEPAHLFHPKQALPQAERSAGTYPLDLSAFPAGVYYVQLREGAHQAVRKVVKWE